MNKLYTYLVILMIAYKSYDNIIVKEQIYDIGVILNRIYNQRQGISKKLLYEIRLYLKNLTTFDDEIILNEGAELLELLRG
jgi:hypothetical protein